MAKRQDQDERSDPDVEDDARVELQLDSATAGRLDVDRLAPVEAR